ncbi:MAG TPA: ABC transporter permease [Paludibacteraceae bacterium]|nr:ABC transporter permease [Paludibacteraceae bacterium]
MIKYLLKKEFKQIIRNPFLPRMILVFPFVVLLVFPWAANYEIRNMNASIVDNDHSSYSRRLTQTIVSSEYFKLADFSSTYNEALKSIEQNKADVIIQIPANFEKDIINRNGTKIMISPNAVNGMKGGIAVAYLSQIVSKFNSTILVERFPQSAVMSNSFIQTDSLFQFNKELNYQVFMVPALMVMILTLLCGFLPAVSIVFEKEIGTMEQINVSPVPKIVFILAKLIPFWLIGFIVITIGFGVAWGVYGLVPNGHFYTIYIFAFIFILGISGLGLVISNYAQTMQQAVFIVFFFMVIFIMMSGLYTPIDSMPNWGQWIAAFDPLKYFMSVMRSVYLKGSDTIHLLKDLCILCMFAVFFNAWAIISYRKSQ